MIGYVVVEWNRASKQPAIYSEELFRTLDEVVEAVAEARRRTAEVGRKESYSIGVVAKPEDFW